jgi:hypothetical protein
MKKKVSLSLINDKGSEVKFFAISLTKFFIVYTCFTSLFTSQRGICTGST